MGNKRVKSGWIMVWSAWAIALFAAMLTAPLVALATTDGEAGPFGTPSSEPAHVGLAALGADDAPDGLANGTYRLDNGNILIKGFESGDVSYDAAAGKLTLANIKASGDMEIHRSMDLAIEFIGDSTIPQTDILPATSSDDVRVNIYGLGSIRGKLGSDLNCTVAGITVNGKLYTSGASLTLVSGTVNGEVDVDGPFEMQGGTISCTDAELEGVSCEGFNMSGGSINAKGGMFGIASGGGDFTITDGKITCTSQSESGIWVGSNDFYMRGGEVAITKCEGNAIEAREGSPDGETFTGKVVVTGGSLTVKSKYSDAVGAGSMTNDPNCLKSVAGRLPKGASFIVEGNLYKVTQSDAFEAYASLEKYASSAKSYAFPKKIKFGGVKYSYSAIEAGAFSTPSGAKVKSLKFQGYLPALVGKSAFSNTKSLTKLTFASLQIREKRTANGNLKSVKWSHPSQTAKTAFSKCGKSNGMKLTVVIANKKLTKRDAKLYKKLFTSKGMSKAVKVK